MGPSFSVAPEVRPLPGSLVDIHREPNTGPGLPRPSSGDLPSVESAPPSSMSADRGFFGSRPFSRADDLPIRQGAQPVDRRLP